MFSKSDIPESARSQLSENIYMTILLLWENVETTQFQKSVADLLLHKENHWWLNQNSFCIIHDYLGHSHHCLYVLLMYSNMIKLIIQTLPVYLA